MLTFTQANSEDDGQSEAVIKSILEESAPARPGDVVHTYFARMGLDFALPQSVRIHPGLNYLLGTRESLGRFPALVLPIQDSKGRYRAIELLYLDESGTPAPVINPRQAYWLEDIEPGTFMTIQQPTQGACGVAVGFGEALAANHFTGAPMYAVGSPDDLEAFQIPEGISHLLVFARSDCQAQALALHERAEALGIVADVIHPSDGYPSWMTEFALRGAVPIDEIAKRHSDEFTTPNEETDHE
jgi:hypothetical protein